MHDLLLSVILGVIEGVTEFLPVSSTAHLRIAQGLFGIPLNDPFWKMYAVVIQLGAVMCLPVYFWPRIKKLVGTFPKGAKGDRNLLTHPLSLVMVAFVCTAIPAVLLKKVISANLENPTVIGCALLIGGALMWAVDGIYGRKEDGIDDDDQSFDALSAIPAASKPTEPNTLNYAPPGDGNPDQMESMTLFQSVWIGLIQTLAAVFPGTSRSMATIAAGQTAGLTRSTALEFSFFLSMPTMAAACLKELKDTIKPSAKEIAEGAVAAHVSGSEWLVIGVGFVVSFFVAIAVVHWFMGWVRKRGFMPFAVYRIILGLLILGAVRFAHFNAPVSPAEQAAASAAAREVNAAQIALEQTRTRRIAFERMKADRIAAQRDEANRVATERAKNERFTTVDSSDAASYSVP